MDNKQIIGNNPLVSVIIPSYNRETLIEETLDSILAQTYPIWECIIVDDGSTDGTMDVIKKYCEKDERFRFFERKRNPKGAPTCRNIGLKKAKGDYVIFLDSDDLLAPFALKERVKSIKDTSFDVVVSPQLLFNEKPYDDLTLVNIRNSKNVFDRFLCIANETDIPWVNNSTIWSTNSLKQHNIFWNEQLLIFQDIDFNLNIFWQDLKFKYSNNEPDCFWRQNKHVTIGKQPFSKKKINSISFLIKKIHDNITEKKLQNYERTNSLKRMYYSLIHFQCLKNREFGYALHLLKNAYNAKIINFKDLIRLHFQIALVRSLQFSDRAKKVITDKYNVFALREITERKLGDFKKHFYDIK